MAAGSPPVVTSDAEPPQLPEWATPFGPAPRRDRVGPRAKRALQVTGVATLVVLAATLGYAYLPVLPTCAIADRVGLYNISAPGTIENYPVGGGAGLNVSGQNWSFASGSIVLGNRAVSNGGFGMWTVGNASGVAVDLSQRDFAVYAVHNVSGPALGGSHPCTQPYVAEAVGTGYCTVLGGVYPLPAPSNDTVEPHVFNSSCPEAANQTGIQPGGYMWIDSAYPASPAPDDVKTLDLCGWTTNFSQSARGLVAVPVILYVPDHGQTISVRGYLWWVSVFENAPTATYELPYGAIWRVATVGLYSENITGLLPPGLLAFERLPCPS